MTEPNYDSPILNATQEYIREFFDKTIPAEYVYHDLNHTINVVEAVRELGINMDVQAKELELLELAAWFHDSGYDQGAENHEARGADYAQAFLQQHNYPDSDIATIRQLIMATQMPYEPK